MVLAVQLVLGTLAAYAFARFEFRGRERRLRPGAGAADDHAGHPDGRELQDHGALGLLDTLVAIGLPYFASAFAIFLLRQTFMRHSEGTRRGRARRRRERAADAVAVYVPLARPVYIAFALVSVSFHWNNFLWPLIITNSVNARPLTVGLQVFSSVDQGVDWSIITAATLMTSAPLLIAFLLFQRQFVQSFMRAGIR